MATTPVYDFSRVFPNAGLVRPAMWVGPTNSRRIEGIGAPASLTADRVVELTYELPHQLASAPAADIVLKALANATSGAAKLQIEWAVVDVADDPDAATLQDEGTQTLTWGAGDDNELLELVVDLDASPGVVQGDAEKWLYVRLTFETTDWTLAALSYWFPVLRIATS